MSLILLSSRSIFWLDESRGSFWATFTIRTFLPEHSFMLKSYRWGGWVAHMILVSAQVPLVLTLGLWTLGLWTLGLWTWAWQFFIFINHEECGRLKRFKLFGIIDDIEICVWKNLIKLCDRIDETICVLKISSNYVSELMSYMLQIFHQLWK